MKNKTLLFFSLIVLASCGSKKATVVTDENHAKFQQYFYEGEKAKMEEVLDGGTGSFIRKETKKAVRSARQEPTQASPEPPLASQQMSSGSGAADPHLAAQQQKLLDKGN